ncbi:protein of unknown function [Thauera humireducens]|nr:protein of unknown function [Thauera humireducens]
MTPTLSKEESVDYSAVTGTLTRLQNIVIIGLASHPNYES